MIIEILIAFCVGIALGWFFVGGLWMTVRKLPTAESPMLLSMSSLLLRLAVTLIGFWLVGRGSWRRLVAALIGFVLIKFLLVSRLGKDEIEEAARAREAKKQGESPREVDDAPQS